MNLMVLYFIGNLFIQYFTQKQLLHFYLLGTFFGGLLYIFSQNYFPLFESNISPLLRFIHLSNIQACGNIVIAKNSYEHTDIPLTTSDIEITAKWNDIKSDVNEYQSPFKILAYDIECDSSHGDFPLPIKDYTKLAREIYYAFLKVAKNDPDNLLENKTKFVNKCLLAAFKKGNEALGISKIYNKSFGQISKYSRNTISSKVADCLVFSNTSNSIEIKNHNIKCIESINVILNNTKTYEELLE